MRSHAWQIIIGSIAALLVGIVALPQSSAYANVKADRVTATMHHLYTTSTEEASVAVQKYGFTFEGVAYYTFAGQHDHGIPLYRLYQPSSGDRLYTVSADEMNIAIQRYGYTLEGIASWVYESDGQNGAVPLYRASNGRLHDHLFTISAAERDAAVAQYGYQDEGTACFVLPAPSGDAVPMFRLSQWRA
ncbi:hypothetical protein [Kutzneria buriramensis]|uniref:DUF5648 domain-containing protein n=1 Tax=Kutzneria buriramensis TaxID=1045776 RepID=A0A3E0HMS0_9PSEU|nr:hypothetical protein [Kutzneria buriramensis]REH47305.1 hypothetical protein BCF44_106470 [Kutzneria buriramensis]